MYLQQQEYTPKHPDALVHMALEEHRQ